MTEQIEIDERKQRLYNKARQVLVDILQDSAIPTDVRSQMLGALSDEISEMLGSLDEFDWSTELECPECNGKMVLRNSRFGLFYGCMKFPQCKATHGAHQHNGKPLGTPANKETKRWRMKAHDAFDRLWKNGGELSRSGAYKWMQEKMSLPAEEAHIGMFTAFQCKELLKHCGVDLAEAE